MLRDSEVVCIEHVSVHFEALPLEAPMQHGPHWRRQERWHILDDDDFRPKHCCPSRNRETELVARIIWVLPTECRKALTGRPSDQHLAASMRSFLEYVANFDVITEIGRIGRRGQGVEFDRASEFEPN